MRHGGPAQVEPAACGRHFTVYWYCPAPGAVNEIADCPETESRDPSEAGTVRVTGATT